MIWVLRGIERISRQSTWRWGGPIVFGAVGLAAVAWMVTGGLIRVLRDWQRLKDVSVTRPQVVDDLWTYSTSWGLGRFLQRLLESPEFNGSARLVMVSRALAGAQQASYRKGEKKPERVERLWGYAGELGVVPTKAQFTKAVRLVDTRVLDVLVDLERKSVYRLAGG